MRLPRFNTETLHSQLKKSDKEARQKRKDRMMALAWKTVREEERGEERLAVEGTFLILDPLGAIHNMIDGVRPFQWDEVMYVCPGIDGEDFFPKQEIFDDTLHLFENAMKNLGLLGHPPVEGFPSGYRPIARFPGDGAIMTSSGWPTWDYEATVDTQLINDLYGEPMAFCVEYAILLAAWAKLVRTKGLNGRSVTLPIDWLEESRIRPLDNYGIPVGSTTPFATDPVGTIWGVQVGVYKGRANDIEMRYIPLFKMLKMS